MRMILALLPQGAGHTEPRIRFGVVGDDWESFSQEQLDLVNLPEWGTAYPDAGIVSMVDQWLGQPADIARVIPTENVGMVTVEYPGVPLSDVQALFYRVVYRLCVLGPPELVNDTCGEPSNDRLERLVATWKIYVSHRKG